jgi:hypothetical protein
MSRVNRSRNLPTPRGRPEAAATRAARLRHIDCAYHLLSRRYGPSRVAALFDISRTSVFNWTRAALAYDDEEAEGLRRSDAGRRWLARYAARGAHARPTPD